MALPYLSSLAESENGHSRSIRLSTPRFLYGKCLRANVLIDRTDLSGISCTLKLYPPGRERKNYKDYVQECRTILAATQLDSLSEAVRVVILTRAFQLRLPGRRSSVSVLRLSKKPWT